MFVGVWGFFPLKICMLLLWHLGVTLLTIGNYIPSHPHLTAMLAEAGNELQPHSKSMAIKVFRPPNLLLLGKLISVSGISAWEPSFWTLLFANAGLILLAALVIPIKFKVLLLKVLDVSAHDSHYKTTSKLWCLLTYMSHWHYETLKRWNWKSKVKRWRFLQG